MNHKLRLKYRYKKLMSKALSLVLSAALLAGGLGISYDTTVFAETSQTESGTAASYAEGSYADFTTNETVANLSFGTDVTASSVYNETDGKGFSNIEYNTEAVGWSGGVYNPRVPSADHVAGASYVTNGDGYLQIASKVWTETEETGYGVYTYENTSSYDMALPNADYKVSVTFANPTDAAYTAYVESEDITKVSDIAVAAGGTATAEFTSCLIDGVLNLKFLVGSSATTIDDATTQSVYVSNVKVTRLATEEVGIKPTIYIASDSTVQTYAESYYPQTGWGQTLYQFFGEFVDEYDCDDCSRSEYQAYETENVIVENHAIGGRSSSSYIAEGFLDDILEDIKPGDYLFVQWGHNDATTARPNRYVSSADFEQWIQMYVDGALQRGAIPVLVTPVARYSYSEEVGAFVGNFEAYGDVMREMAEEQDLAIVDLTERSVALCNQFGIEGAKSLFMVASGDSTHLSYYGAYKFAQCVAKGIAESGHASVADLATKVSYSIPEEVPGVVTNLKTTAVGSSSVTLTWDEVEGAELYYIYRKVVGEDVSGNDAAVASADVSGNDVSGSDVDDEDAVFTDADTNYSVSTTNTALDSGCESGVTYIYSVRAFNEKGLGEFSDTITVTTKDALYKFDINTTYQGSQPTEEGWIGVTDSEMYSATKGYGWIIAPGTGRDRGEYPDNPVYNLMTRDGSLGAGEFALDLPNGDYEVTCYGGDLSSTSTQKTGYLAEGLSIGSISAKQTVTSTTGTVRVTDGQLNISVVSAGTTLLYFNGFTVTEIQKAPSDLRSMEINIDETTGAANYLVSFVGVDEATAYKIYTKNSTDTKYNLAKEVSLEEYAQGPNVYGYMAADAGETYSVYVTAVLADGSESAPSLPVEVKTVLEGEQAAAPANLVCTDPTTDETELQKSITIEWDAVDDAIKYIIYRSTRLEDQKGYKGFEKVGESKTTSYTDVYSKDNEVATNIPYYYKVAALTVTGVGVESDICTTPVTGELEPGNLEEYADRAVVAINLAGKDGGENVVTATDAEGNEYTTGVYLSWRSFEADLDENNDVTTTFDVYRGETLIADDIKVTNLIDPQGTADDTYKVVGSNDEALGLTAKDTAVWAEKYLELNLYSPEDATMPDGTTCDYHANDMSVGDLDGDGDLELIVKWYPSNAQDNSKGGYTGKTYLDGYDVDFATGTVKLLWRIDMGVNIRSGAHYTQFQVWDYDGDGKAEIAVKTADGTTTYKSTDGTVDTLTETGYVGLCNSDALPVATISEENDYRNDGGYILDGPEYFSIFNGEDGTKAAEDVDYLPGRGNVSAWGDGYGGRVDRFLSGTAYLDGETPFAVFCRGYYTRTCLTAYQMVDTNEDGIGDTIEVYWEFDTDVAGTQYEAEGNHSLSVNDVDNDGRDEIIYGALVIDNNGEVLYSTGLGHGDAQHTSDWVSWNEGLEIMSVHEHVEEEYHVEVRDAETGEILMGYNTGFDTGRGVAADIDPTAEGAEWWSIAGPAYTGADEPSWDSTDAQVYSSWSTLEELIKLADTTPASNASMFWDGDLLSEIQDHTFNNTAYAPTGVRIYKWNYEEEQQEVLLGSSEIWSNNGTKGNVGLLADILGDWREEIIARTSSDKNVVRVYSTTIETDYVVPCLLEDLAYREGVAWQNVGYNQPANVTYLLSQGLVTAQLYEGSNTSASQAELLFTPANDGDLFGHDITAYKVLRAAVTDGVVGDFEEIATVDVDDLVVREVYKEEEPDGPVNPFVEYYREDFEDGASDFAAISSGTDSIQADPATVNPNTSSNIYTVYGQSGGGRGAISTEHTYSEDGTIVKADVRLDGGIVGQDTTFALLSAKETNNSLVTTKQILTLKGNVASGTNGWYTSFTINGVDIFDTAVSKSATSEAATSGRGSTGWLHMEAQLNFTKQAAKVVLTRVSDGSVVYEGIVPFAAEATELKYMYMGAGRTTGAVSVDNIVIGHQNLVAEDWVEDEPEEEPEEDVSDGDVSGGDVSGGDVSDGDAEEVTPVWLKLDFGTETTQEGWTAIDATTVYSEELGYGFISTLTGQNKVKQQDYSNADESLAAVYDDYALFYGAGTHSFKMNVPNGTYDLTFYHANGHGRVQNTIVVNGTELGTFSRNALDGVNDADRQVGTMTATVTVTDGIILVENTSSSGRPSAYFNGLEIKDVTYDEWYEAWLEETKPVQYLYDFGAGELQDGWKAIDATTVYSEELGYGFISTLTGQNKVKQQDYSNADESLAAVYDDYALFYGAGTHSFKMNVPNGNYDLTFYHANGHGRVQNTIVVNGTELGTFSRNALDGVNDADRQVGTMTATVTVTDGIILVENTSSSGRPSSYFNGLAVIPEDYDEAYAAWYKLYCDWYGIVEEEPEPDVSDGNADVSGGDADVSGGDVSGSDVVTETVSLFSFASAASVSGGDVSDGDVSDGDVEDEVDDTKVYLDIDADWVYSYTDTTVKGNTEYVYKIAAVVDNKTSHISRGLTVKTAVAVEEVLTIELKPLVEGTPLAEGQTVADLLPKTVKVVDDEGNTIDCDVIWDVSAVDINTVGTYPVIASFKANDITVETTVEVIANYLVGVAELDDVKVVQGSEVSGLPTEVSVDYANTTSATCAVTWDTTPVNVNVLGEYEIEGTITGYDNMKAYVTVVIVPNYIASVANQYVEIELGAKKVELPETVPATWGNGLVTERAVTWSGKDKIDTTVLGDVVLTGTVPGYDKEIKCTVTVAYPVVYKFDFGVVDSPVAEGWTGVVVNKRVNLNPDNGDVWAGGTLNEIGGTVYTKELGYGFLDGEAKTDGRWEIFTAPEGPLTPEVYQDFALPAGQTFVVDLENGKYQVSALSNSYYKSDITVTAEGVYFTANNSAESYTWGTVDTEVTDGQMTIYFNPGRTSRMGAIVIREIIELNEDGTVSGGDADVSGSDTEVEVEDIGLKVKLANPGEEYIYTGSAIKPEIIVTNNGEELTMGVDYTVKYSNNTNASIWKTNKKTGEDYLAKPAKITVTGKGQLTGSATTTFEIKPANLEASEASGALVVGSVVVKTGSKATPVLTFNNKKLTTANFTNANAKTKYYLDSEDKTMTITGKGNFEGSLTIPVTVVAQKQSFTVVVDTKTAIYYDGEEHEAPIKVYDKADKKKTTPLTEGVDYEIVYGSSQVNAGTVKFTVVGKGLYSGTVAKTFKIKPMVVKEEGYFFSFGVDEEYTYKSTGVTLSDSLIIMTNEGETLTEGVDYKITYSNNKAVSTWKTDKKTKELYVSKPAKYTVTFLGNYKGSSKLTGTFIINPAPLSDDMDGLKIAVADKVYTKKNTYASKPVVTLDNVTLKASSYTVTYYKDAALTDKITSKNKITDADFAEGETSVTVYVKLVGKGNYKPVDDEYATAEYQVCKKSDNVIDLSKAKVTVINDETGKKLSKATYTGEVIEPTVKVEYKPAGSKKYVVVDPSCYDVTYMNNLKKGKATVIVTGNGISYNDGVTEAEVSFVGSKTTAFTIAQMNLKNLKDLLLGLFAKG